MDNSPLTMSSDDFKAFNSRALRFIKQIGPLWHEFHHLLLSESQSDGGEKIPADLSQHSIFSALEHFYLHCESLNIKPDTPNQDNLNAKRYAHSMKNIARAMQRLLSEHLISPKSEYMPLLKDAVAEFAQKQRFYEDIELGREVKQYSYSINELSQLLTTTAKANIPLSTGLAIHIDEQLTQSQFRFCPSYLKIIIENIVSNSIKFPKADTPLAIKLTLSPGPKRHELTLAITDNGIGIPKATLDKLNQGEKLTQTTDVGQIKGTNIGTADIVNAIQNGLGGSYQVLSQQGSAPYTQWQLILPIRLAAKPQSMQSQEHAMVLYAEDSRIARKIMMTKADKAKKALKFNFITTENKHQCIAAFKDQLGRIPPVDILFLDEGLGDGTAAEVINEIIDLVSAYNQDNTSKPMHMPYVVLNTASAEKFTEYHHYFNQGRVEADYLIVGNVLKGTEPFKASALSKAIAKVNQGLTKPSLPSITTSSSAVLLDALGGSDQKKLATVEKTMPSSPPISSDERDSDEKNDAPASFSSTPKGHH